MHYDLLMFIIVLSGMFFFTFSLCFISDLIDGLFNRDVKLTLITAIISLCVFLPSLLWFISSNANIDSIKSEIKPNVQALADGYVSIYEGELYVSSKPEIVLIKTEGWSKGIYYNSVERKQTGEKK